MTAEQIRNMTPAEKCKLLGCSMEQLSNQYAGNAEALEGMYKKAIKTGKKVNGYTAEQLDQMTAKYYQLATDTMN